MTGNERKVQDEVAHDFIDPRHSQKPIGAPLPSPAPVGFTFTNKNLEMQLRVTLPLTLTPDGVRKFLEERNLRLPVFFDAKNNLVIDFNQRSRNDALELLNWLITR